MPRKKSILRERIPFGKEVMRFSTLANPVTPTDVESVLQDAKLGRLGRLHELYERMESTDDRYGGVVSNLKTAISSKKAKLLSPKSANPKDRAIAEQYKGVVEFALRDVDKKSTTEAFIEPHLTGTKPYELIYDFATAPKSRVFRIKRPAIIKEVRPVPTRRLAMEVRDEANRGKLGLLDDKGQVRLFENYRSDKVFHIDAGMLRGKYDMAGTARRCLAWYTIKTNVVPWWGEYTELYGEPMRIGRYPDDLDDDVLMEIEAMLETLGRQGWALLPEDLVLEFKEAQRSGTVTTYRDIIAYADNAYAISVLGANQTVDGGRNGSFAKSKTHNAIRHEIMQGAAHLAELGWAKVIHGILTANFGADYRRDLAPKFVIVIANPEDMAKKASAYSTLSRLGVPISETQLREEFALSSVDDDEPIIVGGRRYENMAEYLSALSVQREMESLEPGSQRKRTESPSNERSPANPSKGTGEGEKSRENEREGASRG